MARPLKKGLDYFPMDVDVFSDKKIRVLYSRFGSDGFSLYVYLLCQIFKEGYYMAVDDDLSFIASSDLNMSVEKIRLMMNFLLERSLFDNKLFKSDKVLTSAGIQRRYQQAVRSRAVKNPVTVNERFWLLKNEETETFIKVRSDENYSKKNGSYSEKNDSYSENNDIKESKVNKSKGKESKVCVCELPCREGSFVIDENFYTELTHTYPDMNIDSSLHKLKSYLLSNPEKQRSKNKVAGQIMWWLDGDNEKGRYRKQSVEYGAAYDISEYESSSAYDDEN